jgi:hypothetical protein
MDRAELTERLAKAREAVPEGDASIQHQRELIARLKASGQDTSEARVVLDALLKRQLERHANLGHIMRQFPPD